MTAQTMEQYTELGGTSQIERIEILDRNWTNKWAPKVENVKVIWEISLQIDHNTVFFESDWGQQWNSRPYKPLLF